MTQQREDNTRLLSRAVDGDSGSVRKLMQVVYRELRNQASRYFRGERANHTLQPTALVHEAFLRLVDQKGLDWRSRSHFFALGAREMRRILVDHARRRDAAKRGGSWSRIEFDEAALPSRERPPDVLEVEEVLEKLSKLDSRAARVAELRFFGGLKIKEVAEALSVSERTVRDDWHMAQAWLARELSKGE